MDHYQNPRHKGQIKQADFTSQSHNPSCGDLVTFYGRVKDGRIAEVAFEGSGCIISQAAASLLSESIQNKSLKEILALDKEDMKKLVGVLLGPVRLKCALLSLEALQDGVKKYKTGNKSL